MASLLFAASDLWAHRQTRMDGCAVGAEWMGERERAMEGGREDWGGMRQTHFSIRRPFHIFKQRF